MISSPPATPEQAAGSVAHGALAANWSNYGSAFRDSIITTVLEIMRS
jgi:hypothetical protein